MCSSGVMRSSRDDAASARGAVEGVAETPRGHRRRRSATKDPTNDRISASIPCRATCHKRRGKGCPPAGRPTDLHTHLAGYLVHSGELLLPIYPSDDPLAFREVCLDPPPSPLFSSARMARHACRRSGPLQNTSRRIPSGSIATRTRGG